MMELRFSVSDGSSKTCNVSTDHVIWVGRNEECEIVLSSLAVSRRHASFAWDGQALVITDHSQNGTQVDGLLLRQASQRLLDPISRVVIGPFSLEITRSSPSGSASLAGDPPASLVRAPPAIRRRIHRALLDHLELPRLNCDEIASAQMRNRVQDALRRIIGEMSESIQAVDREPLIAELSDEVLGLGPLEPLLGDEDVSEIMVVDPSNIYVERRGKLELTALRFTDGESVRAIIERIITPLGRRIDESNPVVDARLSDGSRVHAIIPPLTIKGACLTIRKFTKQRLEMADLIRSGSLDRHMARFLEHAVRVRRNIVISGGTGSGKTTLLNILSGAISASERIVTIEDAAELKLAQPHVVSLEARAANMEGKGEFSIRSLVKNALRMRPDRIIVGECRGDETLDMLQAMNTGHEGSMTSTHANSPMEAISRIETLCLMAGTDLPLAAVRAQIATSIHLVVQQARFADGTRRVTSIAEVTGLTERGDVRLVELFNFSPNRQMTEGLVGGEFRATGQLPTFLDRLSNAGLLGEDSFL